MLGGISIWQLVIVLAIVIMIFGTKKLRSMGGDLGSAVKGFKKAMHEEEDNKEQSKQAENLTHNQAQEEANFSDNSTQEKASTDNEQSKS